MSIVNKDIVTIVLFWILGIILGLYLIGLNGGIIIGSQLVWLPIIYFVFKK